MLSLYHLIPSVHQGFLPIPRGSKTSLKFAHMLVFGEGTRQKAERGWQHPKATFASLCTGCSGATQVTKAAERDQVTLVWTMANGTSPAASSEDGFAAATALKLWMLRTHPLA